MGSPRSNKSINTVEGNTAPPLVLTAQRGKAVIPLAGCTVALVITNNGVVMNAGHQACTITDAPNGVVEYVREAGDISKAGTYPCDLVITYSDSTVETLWTQLILNVAKASGSTT